jgi:hypothetical protein
MKLRTLILALVAIFAAALASGCATHTANKKTHTVVLGGLLEIEDGAYEATPAATLPLNTEEPLPGSNLTGNKVSILWGLFSYRDQ